MEASRAAGHPAFGSPPVGQPARNPGLERRETWGTRLRLPGLRAGQALYKAKSALLRMTSRTAGHPAFGSPPVGQPARNPGLERRETWGTRLRLLGLRAGQALHKAKSALLRMTSRTAGHPAFGSPPVGQPARNPGLEKARDLGHPAQTPWASLGTGSSQGKKRVAPDDVKNSWDTRPLGRHLWVSRRGTQVSKGARPGAPGHAHSFPQVDSGR
jgi:hypothetical protein